MHVSPRSYLSAGVAVFGAGAIALSPVQPLELTSAPHKAISDLAVGLAAAVTPVDPLQNIIDVITASGANLETLVGNWAGGLYVDGTFPFPPNTNLNGNLGWRTGGYATDVALPILFQFVSNLEVYLGELPDIGGILGQVFENAGNALMSPFEAGVEKSGRVLNLIPSDNYNQNVNAVPYINVPDLGVLSQRDVGALLPILAGDTYASLKPILDFATTPISGLLVGLIGPIVAPVLAVVNGISNAFELLREGEFVDALTELVNLPANAIGAFLNGGQTLDLTPLVGLLGVELPETIKSIGLKMGGLLSPGGVAFDAIAAEAEIPDLLSVTVPGLPVGPLGALASLTNYVSRSIVVTPPAAPVQEEAPVTPVEPEAPVTPVEPEAPVDEGAGIEQGLVEETVIDEEGMVVVTPVRPLARAVAAAASEQAETDDAAPVAPPTVNRGGRGVGASSDDAGSGASTPKRASRGAAARG